MKKRILSIVLCLCLLVPFMGVVAGQTVSAADEEPAKYILKELGLRISTTVQLGSGGNFFSSHTVKFDEIDLTEYDYGEETEHVAIQMDTYVSGDDLFLEYVASTSLGGQFEIASSGTYDEEEVNTHPGNVLKFTDNQWMRITIPMSAFDKETGKKKFNPAKFNAMRIYFSNPVGNKYVGASGMIKIVNTCLVDTSVPENERPEMDLGDGTFRPEPPEFHQVKFAPGYDDSITMFAGYNLKEYVDTYDVETKNPAGKEDWAPIINSLLDGLNSAGGGALFIPAGYYECRSEVIVPAGTTIIGEWANPDENPEIRGTILEVYCGAGSATGAAFITMLEHTQVRNISIWYPEQTVERVEMYPPSIETFQYTFVQNVTLVNSYFGIQNKTSANCPNAWNIYGTPLNIGVDFDIVIDIARIEELHFAAKYWANSGLDGAPVTPEARKMLDDQLYNYGIGITLRRIDWSYVTYSDIVGYNIGLLFDLSSNGNNWPNGQCVGLNFTNCKYGHFAYGVSGSSESLLDITMKNCEYGIYLAPCPETTGNGKLQYYNADIQATKYAVYQDSMVNFNLFASTIRSGEVVTEDGNNIFVNNKIMTSAPQIKMECGTVAGVLIGNTDAYGDPIEYTNPGRCTYSYVEEKMDLQPYTKLTREEAAGYVKAPTGSEVIIPNDLDTTGETDVTEQINTYLTTLANNGGGILFLKPGKYRINGALYIPSGVELRGSADFASIPKAVNTILLVYTAIEDGKDQYTSTATVTMAENSGMRGVIFNYPIQNTDPTVVDTVFDPIKSREETKKAQDKADEEAGGKAPDVTPVEVYVDYYEFTWHQYPFTVRGTGSDIYLVNVTIRNGWNGVDFKTYRCDNHYIDYLAGHFFNRGIVVGGGSENGYIRNFQFNYNSIYSNTDVWGGFGGEPSTSTIRSGFHQPMQAQFNNNSIILQLGDVNNQLVYNCFNYASYIGVHLVDENGESANARFYGHGVDYGTVSLQVEAAEHVEFVNMQLTAFNQAGSDANTGRYAVDQTTTPIYDIWLKDTFDGEITVTNFTEWAPSPNSGVRVDGGRLNMYNAQFSHSKSHLFELHNDGELNIVGFSSPREDNPILAQGKLDNLYITAGYYYSELSAPESTKEEPVMFDPADVGAFDHVYLRELRYAVPENVTFTDDSKVVFVESFDEYEFTDTTTFQVNNTKYGTLRRGAVRLRLDLSQFAIGLEAGQNRDQEMPFALTGGNKDDLYRMEWRIKIDEMRDTNYSEIYLYLSDPDIKSELVATIKKDGSVVLSDGSVLSSKIEFGTYYRLAVEVDARNTNNKTATLYLLNDDSRVLAKGATIPMKKSFQGNNHVSGFWFVAMADPIDVPETVTDLYIDYFFITRSEVSSIGRNVTEGDEDTGLRGDLDGNDKVDSTDARLALQYAVKKISGDSINTAMADVDGNNKVDSTDARLILQYAVKKIKDWP